MNDIIIKCNKCGKVLYKDNQQFVFDYIRYKCDCGTDVLIDERLFIAKHFVDVLKENNLIESIELNQKRFNYSDELKQILINTVNMYFK